MREVLSKVLWAAHEETDTYGSSVDQDIVRRFITDPANANFDDYVYVSRVRFVNFYANTSAAFNRASLWQEIERQIDRGDEPQPVDWDETTEVGVIALWLHDLVKQ